MMIPKLIRDPSEERWLAGAADVRRVVLRLAIGSMWRFSGFLAAVQPGESEQKWHTVPGLYRIVCVAKHVRSLQSMVVHVGVGGPDDGKAYACPLGSWEQFFSPADEPGAKQAEKVTAVPVVAAAKAAEPMPEKVAGVPLESRGRGH